MKRWLVLFTMFCFSQIGISQDILVLNEIDSFIYNGAKTPIQLVFQIQNYDSVSVTGSHGNLERRSESSYYWTVCERTLVKPKVFVQVFQNGKLICAKETAFLMKYMPNPIAIVSCSNLGHSARLRQIHVSECLGIRSILETFDYVARCRVEHFQVTYIKDGELFKEWKNKGEMFEKHTKELLEQAKKGDMIIFSDITTRCGCDGFTRKLGEIEIEIKN